MRRTPFLFMLLLASLVLTAAPADISGTWTFSVDLEGGGHGDPTFVLKQEGAKVSGTYSGPVGEQKVTGTVTGNKAILGFDFERDGSKVHATYTATIDSAKAMHGTMEFKADGNDGGGGKWTATKK